ncbi:MAG: DNA primase [Cyanobacterium sp. T60_A2020_053]|nr:DNA primase [Cyanobacterium sp. T60_A2020_053]
MDYIRLHPETIAEVKDKIDLVEIISDYVVLQKKGNELSGLCPFHEEKSPSFSVNPVKQLYYCFGCGAGGGAVKFLMDINKQSFKEVVLDLAQRYHIPIKSLAPEQQKEIQRQITIREQLYEILAVASGFFQHSLQQPQGRRALDYLQQERKLDDATIQQFKLGYAPDNWDTLYNYLVEVKHYSISLVAKAGLIKERKNGGGYIDYFKHRLMIPICDKDGRIIAFGARSLDGSEPKYLNSPDTELFSKSHTLFLLDQAKQAIAKNDKVIIVEGYFDAIALHSQNIKNVVAVLGTALTSHHVKILSRYTDSKEIIVNFDADKAGIKATERAIKEVENLIYTGQLKLKVVNIPNGKDADEFLNASDDSVEKYQRLIDSAPLWLDWQIDQILKDKNLSNSGDFELVFQGMTKLIRKISNEVTKNHYLLSCAEILTKGRSPLNSLNSQELTKIYHNLENNSKSYQTKAKLPRKSLKSTVNSQVEEAEFLLLLIYLHCPSWRETIVNYLDEKDLLFSLDHYRFLWQQINYFSQNIDIDYHDNKLLTTLQENMVNHPEFITFWQPLFNPSENNKQRLFAPESNINFALACLEGVNLEKYKQYCQQQITIYTNNQDMEKMSYFFEEIKKIEQQLKDLKQSII